MAAKFIPNPVGLAQVQAMSVLAMKPFAEAIAVAARTIALAEAYDEGDYMEGIKAGDSPDEENGFPVWLVNAWDFKSWWIEAGTSQDPVAHAPMRRASEMVHLT